MLRSRCADEIQRLGEQIEAACRAQKSGRQHQRRCAIGQRARASASGKLSAALVRILLAFRVGVGEQPADRQQQNGAQPQTQPRRHHQPHRFAHQHARPEHQEKAQARASCRREALRPRHTTASKQEEGVDAHLHTHPSAQRD